MLFSSDPPLKESTWTSTVGLHKAAQLQDPSCSYSCTEENKAGIYSFIWHMFVVKQKQNQSIDSIRGQTVTSSLVQVFPRWTLVFFWSTSSGHGVTDEVISCLFWSDLRDWLQMWGAERSSFSWREIAKASSFTLFQVSQGFGGG